MNELSDSLNLSKGQSSVFGDATQGNKIIYLAKVVNNEDRSNMGRITATIINFNEDDGEEEPGKDKNDTEAKIAYPLIYQFVNVIPKVDELVYIVLENPKDQSSRRFYIGPIRSSKRVKSEIELPSSANNLFTPNSFAQIDSTNLLLNSKTVVDSDNISLDGKNDSTIVLGSREALINVGSLIDNTFDVNTKTPCFIQLKDNLQKFDNSNNLIKDSFSQMNIVASNINLISSNSSSAQNRQLDELGNLKDKSNVENNTNPDLETYGNQAKELHPLVLGDELVKLLQIMIRFCLNHKHTPQEKPYGTTEEIQLLNEYLSNENIQKILSKSVRTN